MLAENVLLSSTATGSWWLFPFVPALCQAWRHSAEQAMPTPYPEGAIQKVLSGIPEVPAEPPRVPSARVQAPGGGFWRS